MAFTANATCNLPNTEAEQSGYVSDIGQYVKWDYICGDLHSLLRRELGMVSSHGTRPCREESSSRCSRKHGVGGHGGWSSISAWCG
eukprot:2213708-Amphidinium_carterae.2